MYFDIYGKRGEMNKCLYIYEITLSKCEIDQSIIIDCVSSHTLNRSL